MSTRRPLNQNKRSFAFRFSTTTPLQINQELQQKAKEMLTTNQMDLERETTESELQMRSYAQPHNKVSTIGETIDQPNRAPSFFNPINQLISTDLTKRASLPEIIAEDSKLDLEDVEEEFKRVNKVIQDEPIDSSNSRTPWNQILNSPETKKVFRRKSNFNSQAVLFTKMNLDKDDSF